MPWRSKSSSMPYEVSSFPGPIKSKKRSRQSFYLANDKFSVGDHWIDVPKLGRVNMAENLRFAGKILSARIGKTADWWFVSTTVEVPDERPVNTHPPVGIDVGLNRLATLSDGKRYENQKPLHHLLKRLCRLNKELARRFRIASLRADVLHKLTTHVAKEHGLVAVEDLHIKGLSQNRCVSRAFSDAALGTLLDLLESKVPRAGGRLVKVGRFYPSSQLCHCCGWRRADLSLDERMYVCTNPACTSIGDRDENARNNQSRTRKVADQQAARQRSG